MLRQNRHILALPFFALTALRHFRNRLGDNLRTVALSAGQAIQRRDHFGWQAK